MYNIIDFSGKTIVVAGASSGIGRATAILLSNLGARLVLIARREELLQETLSKSKGESHCYFVWDLSATETIEELAKRIIEKTGPIDGLVYAAGVTCNVPFHQLKVDRIKSVFDINFYAFIELTRHLTKKRFCNNDMSVVAISSTASFLNMNKAQLVYSATKAAINASIRSLAHELGERGIRVNAVAPGMTNTEMFEAFVSRTGENSEPYRKILERQYLGIVSPDAVASSIAFLLSSASSYITGVVLPIDSGMTSC